MTRNAAVPLQFRFMLTPCYIYVDSQLQVRFLLTPHYIYVDSLLRVIFITGQILSSLNSLLVY